MTGNNPTPKRAPSQEWIRKTAAMIANAIHDAGGLSRYGAVSEAQEILTRRVALLAAVRPKDTAPAPTTGGVFRMEGNTLKHERTGPAPVAQEALAVVRQIIARAFANAPAAFPQHLLLGADAGQIASGLIGKMGEAIIDALLAAAPSPPEATAGVGETMFESATERNKRVQARYDELMRAGKHGHYETLFQVVREELDQVLRDLNEANLECARLASPALPEASTPSDPDIAGLVERAEAMVRMFTDASSERATLIGLIAAIRKFQASATAILAVREASAHRERLAVEGAISIARAWDAKGGEPVARQIANDISRLLLKSGKATT